jgi:hypothetical protein
MMAQIEYGSGGLERVLIFAPYRSDAVYLSRLLTVTCSPEFQPLISLVHLLEMDDETQSIY